MRNHVIHISIATLVALMAFAGFNWLVDPAHLFSHGKYEMDIAHQLNKGKFIAGVTNYDERLLQLYRLQDLQNSQPTAWSLPDTVVVGSSRSMQIHSGAGMSVLNLSVSGASIEDYIAILQLADFMPYSKIIIGIDPWVFNQNNDQTRWRSICLTWRMGMERMLNQPAPKGVCSNSKLQQLVNLTYTKASAQLILSRIKEPANSSNDWYKKINDTPEPKSDLIRPDGSRVYNSTFAEMPVTKIIAEAKSYSRPPIYSLRDFYFLDKNAKTLFEALIHRMKRNGKEVVLFLPPYHPSAYSSIATIVPQVKDVEIYLRGISQSLGVRLLGSYNPSNTGCMQEEFFDGMHPRDSCVEKIFATVSSTP